MLLSVTEDGLKAEIQIIKRRYINSTFVETRRTLLKGLEKLELCLARGEYNENNTVGLCPYSISNDLTTYVCFLKATPRISVLSMTARQLEAEIERALNVLDEALSFEVHWSDTYLRDTYSLRYTCESLENRLGRGEYNYLVTNKVVRMIFNDADIVGPLN